MKTPFSYLDVKPRSGVTQTWPKVIAKISLDHLKPALKTINFPRSVDLMIVPLDNQIKVLVFKSAQYGFGHKNSALAEAITKGINSNLELAKDILSLGKKYRDLQIGISIDENGMISWIRGRYSKPATLKDGFIT